MLISKVFDFEAAHWLPRHPGKCNRLHGHSYSVRVELEGPLNPSSQFVMDYADLKSIVQPTIDRWDHRLLNAFIRYSSAENIAAHLAHIVRAQLKSVLINRLVVSVSETKNTTAVWDSRSKEDLFMLDRAAEDAEWKSPSIQIPISAMGTLKTEVTTLDDRVKHLLNELTKEMITREQYALYLETLNVNPALPEILEAKDIQ